MAKMRDYARLKAEIEAKGIQTTFHHHKAVGDVLVCASDKRKHGDLGGGSIWVWYCEDQGGWYLGTWSPCGYRVPTDVNLVEICVQSVLLSKQALPILPTDFVKRFGLVELSDQELQTLYEPST